MRLNTHFSDRISTNRNRNRADRVQSAGPDSLPAHRSVAEPAIAPRRLRRMAGRAETLQIRRGVVGRVAVDVVDDSGWRDALGPLTHDAERIASQCRLANTAPRCAVGRQRALRLTRTSTRVVVPLPLIAHVRLAIARLCDTAATPRVTANRCSARGHSLSKAKARQGEPCRACSFTLDARSAERSGNVTYQRRGFITTCKGGVLTF